MLAGAGIQQNPTVSLDFYATPNPVVTSERARTSQRNRDVPCNPQGLRIARAVFRVFQIVRHSRSPREQRMLNPSLMA
jgi:hypothetical protein